MMPNPDVIYTANDLLALAALAFIAGLGVGFIVLLVYILSDR